jgi:hypothetical protein
METNDEIHYLSLTIDDRSQRPERAITQFKRKQRPHFYAFYDEIYHICRRSPWHECIR